MSSRLPVHAESDRRTRMREQIVAAALALADAEGLEAVTMRRVAAEVGLGTMTLYHYVAGKQELSYLVSDAIAAELLVPGQMPSHWRDALRAIARQTFATFERHPWLLEVTAREAVATPNLLRHIEQSAAAVAPLGLDPATATAMVGATDDYTIGCVVRRRFRSRAKGNALLDPSEQLRPELRTLLDSGELPLMSGWIAAGGRLDLLDEGFEVGLEWLLDGMEAMLAERRGA